MLFLTSNYLSNDYSTLNNENDFVDNLRKSLPDSINVLFIPSDPVDLMRTEKYSNQHRKAFLNSGFKVEHWITWKDNMDFEEAIDKVELIILAGGHVPTQNAFFRKINLKEYLKDFMGVILGISAGSMNTAENVYCPPETEEDGKDPKFNKWLEGLSLTEINILPHYDDLRKDIVGDLRVMEDIIIPDSIGNTFHLLYDGSYIIQSETDTTIYGGFHLLENGQIK